MTTDDDKNLNEPTRFDNPGGIQETGTQRTSGQGTRGQGTSGPGTGDGDSSGRAPGFFTDFVEMFYGIFFSPVRTIRDIAKRPAAPIGAAFTAYLTVVLINAVTGAATAQNSWYSALASLVASGSTGADAPALTGGGYVLATATIALLASPLGLFFKTGAINLMSSFFGGRGQGTRLFAALSVTYLPALVSVPVALLLSGRQDLGVLSLALSIGLFAWRLVLDIIAIREVHGFDTGRATAVALIPLGVIALVAIVVFAVWFALFASMIGPLMQSGLPGVG